MKESDYIKVKNLTLLRSVLGLLRDLLPGDEYGISDVERSGIYRQVSLIETKCDTAVGTAEGV